MRILLLHTDYLDYETKKKALSSADKIKEEDKKGRRENALVCFCAVEEGDEKNPREIVDKLVTEVRETIEKVKAKSVVLYPYAHLSTSLAKPDVATKILSLSFDKLKEEGFDVIKAPFGWYKSFELKVKGHPLSELSRVITPETEGKKLKRSSNDETEALKSEEKLKSYWYILTPGGELSEVGSFDYKGHDNLKKFAFYEKEKVRKVESEPAHVKLMKKLELVDYEPASDSGNLRYYPKGRLIKSLIETYVTERVIDYGGVEVETPIMYDMKHPTLSKYLQRFPARQYQLNSDKREFFLRFAACFGQFLMAHDATISYKNLPLKLYELTRYSFRREQSGELTGLRRLRAFTMPDVHAMCANLSQAMDEFVIRFDLCLDILKNLKIERRDIEMALRTTKKFYEENREYIQNLVKKLGKPILLEMWDERIFYFILKYEFNFVDTLDKASALSTDQIDIENGKRYDIKFTDKEGKLNNPLILHCSPSGAIERVMYALLEKAAFDMLEGRTPILPLWLSPTQVRLLPISGEFLSFSEEITDKLIEENIRTDIDDRDESIGKKIRDGEKEWIPYMLVIGEKEKNKNIFNVRIRRTREDKSMSLGDLTKEVRDQIKGYPFKKLPLPKLVSKRPKFV